MEKGYIIGIKVIDMKENGKIISAKEKGYFIGIMDIDMKEISKMIEWTEKE